jgi:Tol biopolymer transport system component
VPFSVGDKLGPYEIAAPIGAGGMGEVYRAKHMRLDREVAIKVLPAALALDPERLARFEREARVLAALNHPNIAQIYGVEESSGGGALVIELVPGETVKGPLPLETALNYAKQIAEALEAAHEKGIVHRDLKPANIMVTPAGVIKVLDFGLAAVTESSGIRDGDSSQSPTVPMPATRAGMILGTAAYMSPEQAAGQRVDKRADIWAFGVVLYELLSGQRLFSGDSIAHILADVLRSHIDFDKLPKETPTAIRDLLKRCVDRNVKTRLRDIGEARVVISKLLVEDRLREFEDGSSVSPAAPVQQPAFRRRWLEWMIAAACGALLAVGGAWILLRPPPDAALVQAITMLTADTGLSAYPALSRDGSLVAFASDRAGEGNLDIWMQQIGGGDPIRLTRDPSDESDPAIAPDGTRVAFRSEKNGGGVYVVPALGGEPILVASSGRNPRFSPDGRTIAYWTGRTAVGFVPGSASVFAVEAGGGQARPLSAGMAVATTPIWSPKGDELLVLGRKDRTGKTEDSLDWWILPLSGGAPRRTGVFARLSAAKLVYFFGAFSFQPLEWLSNAELKGRGSGSRVLFGAVLGESGNLWEVGLASDGVANGSLKRITLGPGRQTQASEVTVKGLPRTVFADLSLNYDIWTVPLDADRGVVRGEPAPITESLAVKRSPSLSADGKQIAFVRRQIPNWSLRVMDLTTRKERLLVHSEHLIGPARMSGDGSHIAYCDDAGVAFSISSTGGTLERLFEGCGAVMDNSFDGRRILYEPTENEHVTMFDAGLRKSVILARRPPDTVLSGSRFSPDGKWVAFHSIDRSSKVQLWIARIDGTLPVPASEWIAVTDGKYVERDPAWSPGGRLLYYLSEADGFRCIWARRLDPSSKKPVGEAFPVAHFHSVRRSLAPFGTAGYYIGLSVTAGRMIFALTDLKGNLWLQEAAR